ncbi:class I SAM-dependent methyltransferase [Carboxylicivirga sp. N1Y90]|uniref:class I SAM-dependent methyltransferase n=1 Tax=Carboxylicivirga fragile TaxID=3417571 RepID=UPI003D34A7AB|nr:class I SAM-dependent methyltransferase [Marinilabiliaceae bacterium N1Y90]
MNEMWNTRFKEETFFYGQQVNEVLKEFLLREKPGKILLPGEGEGRNAVYAAKLGWQVTAIDFSEEGKFKAEKLAKQNQVEINYIVQDVSTYEAPSNFYDCIACVFLHMPLDSFFEMIKQLTKSLKPNGKLFIVGFHTTQLAYKSGGPKNIDWLYSQSSFENSLKGFNIINNSSFTTKLNEGEGHLGEAAIHIFEGQKID